MTEPIVIYTDGSCDPSTGKGGYGFHFFYKGEHYKGSAGVRGTTNNRMEITAVLEAISRLNALLAKGGGRKCLMIVMSDSRYVVNGYMKWMRAWKANGWKKSNHQKVANMDLWELMYVYSRLFDNLDLVWLKGHAGNPDNEYADVLATMGRESLDKIDG